jgi:hypothetical protein
MGEPARSATSDAGTAELRRKLDNTHPLSARPELPGGQHSQVYVLHLPGRYALRLNSHHISARSALDLRSLPSYVSTFIVNRS